MSSVYQTKGRVTGVKSRLHERQLNLRDTYHFASRILFSSSWTSFSIHAFYDWNDEKRQFATIQFVKRTDNDVEDDVMRDAKWS